MLTNVSYLDRLVTGLSSKSDKIRALAKSGVATADIARYLGIRYQFARNVIKDAGLTKPVPPAEHGFAEAPAHELRMPQESPKAEWVRVGEDGQIMLPPSLLAVLGVKAGARVYIGANGNGLEVLSREGAKKRLDEIASKYKVPGVSVVDEFLAERRREAAKDDER